MLVLLDLQMVTVSTQTSLCSTPLSSPSTKLTSLLMTTLTQILTAPSGQHPKLQVKKLLLLSSQLLPSLDPCLELSCVQFLYYLLMQTSKQEVRLSYVLYNVCRGTFFL